MGVLLFILLIILVLAVLLGAGGYSVRRYWSPAGTEIVEGSDMGTGAGSGIVAAVLALLVLILLFFGFSQWNWFGTRSVVPNNPAVTSPMPTGGGSVQPSPSK